MRQHEGVTEEAAAAKVTGRGAEKALATRRALVELAAKLFAEHGYQQTSIRDIARQGSVTSGAIYGHFRNKADLLVAAINERTAEELEAQSTGAMQTHYVDTLTRLSLAYPERRQLRALIVQGAAAAQTDPETRDRLREEQLSHLNAWLEGYEEARDRLGIDPGVDLQAVVAFTWAVEVGLGVLEAIGLEPESTEGWADVFNRLARGLQLPPDDGSREPPRRRTRRKR